MAEILFGMLVCFGGTLFVGFLLGLASGSSKSQQREQERESPLIRDALATLRHLNWLHEDGRIETAEFRRLNEILRKELVVLRGPRKTAHFEPAEEPIFETPAATAPVVTLARLARTVQGFNR